jgi:serine protease AprX
MFREMVALGKLHENLHDYATTMTHAAIPEERNEQTLPAWWQASWSAVRMGMNTHKWVHPYYQHVDGTSVAVTQVSAVAAQMFEANPNLTARQVRDLLLATALPLAHKPFLRTGQGILQPTQAVAAALRTPNGILANLPTSATVMTRGELRKWLDQGKVTYTDFTGVMSAESSTAIYFGYYAPQAVGVSLVGSFNQWQVDQLPLQRLSNGWWQLVIPLPPGRHLYRFWIDTGPYTPNEWHADPENPLRMESGYGQGHSLVVVG